MRKLTVLSILFLEVSMVSQAQRLSTSAEIRVPVTKTFEVFGSMEYRTRPKLSGNELFSGTAGIDYRVLPWLKASTGYAFIGSRTESKITEENDIVPPYWQHKHRVFVAVTGIYEINHFRFSLRERYQHVHTSEQYVPQFDSNGITRKDDEFVGAKHSDILRSRLQVRYDIPKCKISPYLSGEVYNSLSDGFGVDQTRWTVGISYYPSIKHQVDVYYRYVDKSDNGSEGGSVIGIKYYFKL